MAISAAAISSDAGNPAEASRTAAQITPEAVRMTDEVHNRNLFIPFRIQILPFHIDVTRYPAKVPCSLKISQDGYCGSFFT